MCARSTDNQQMMLSDRPVGRRMCCRTTRARHANVRIAAPPKQSPVLESIEANTMQYRVILKADNKIRARLAHAPNAVQALAMIKMHQAAGEVVRSIRSDQEGEIGLEMLRVLAQEELEELAG